MSNDESFFREVEEDYRREQTARFFKTYGAYLIAGAFVVLAIVGGYKYETQRRAAQAASGGDALSNALNLVEAGNQDEAEKALANLAGNGSGAYRVLARLHAAAESVAKKQLESALQDYRGVADDSAAPAALRDFARIQVAALSVDKESYEFLYRVSWNPSGRGRASGGLPPRKFWVSLRTRKARMQKRNSCTAKS